MNTYYDEIDKIMRTPNRKIKSMKTPHPNKIKTNDGRFDHIKSNSSRILNGIYELYGLYEIVGDLRKLDTESNNCIAIINKERLEEMNFMLSNKITEFRDSTKQIENCLDLIENDIKIQLNHDTNDN